MKNKHHLHSEIKIHPEPKPGADDGQGDLHSACREPEHQNGKKSSP